jgi:trypsin
MRTYGVFATVAFICVAQGAHSDTLKIGKFVPKISIAPTPEVLKGILQESQIIIQDGPDRRKPPLALPPSPPNTAPVDMSGSPVGDKTLTPLQNAQQNLIDKYDPRVIGGKPASVNDFPWQIVLIAGKTPKAVRSPFCGGSLIAYQWVVTAAHCMEDISDPSLVDIVSGSTFPKYQDEGDRVSVSEIKVHPDYKPDTFENDIAVLKLERPVKLGEPIKLPSQALLIPVNSNATVTGWGAVVRYGGMVEHLLKANVPVVSNDTCRQTASYGDDVKPGMLCAGYQEGGVDACQGDSGGPLMAKVDSVPTLIGVVSWGKGCALRLKYGVYTRVTSYVSWVRAAAGLGAVAEARN